MTIHLDASAVLLALVGDGDPLQEWGRRDRAYSNEKSAVQARHTLDRLRLERALDDEGLAHAHRAISATVRATRLIEITPEVLRRASQPIPTAGELSMTR